MKSEPVLKSFQPLRPQFESPQEQGLNWLALAHAKAQGCLSGDSPDFDFEHFRQRTLKALQRFGCGSNRISSRGHELGDFLHTEWGKMRLFNFSETAGRPGTSARTDFYEERVDSLFRRFYPEEEGGPQPPDALLHVTCTGYVSPSGAQKLVAKRSWNERTRVFHVYHMGCSASLPAIGIAAGLLACDRRTRQVDVVHTELCSLHFDPTSHAPEQLVIQTLFADGAIRYALSQEHEPKGLRLLALREVIVPQSDEAMSWRDGDHGMRMALSRDVPTVIGGKIQQFFTKLFEEADLDFEEERRKAAFAIHPGGPRILDQLESLLALEKWQTSASHEVLYRYGNMSSATLPHIWARIIEDESKPEGSLVASVAFGPGLTISGALFAKT